MTDNMAKTFEKMQRQAFRTEVGRIWNLIREGKSADLDPKERKLAVIIMDHGEYGAYFANEELLDGSEFGEGEGLNPFLHISLHEMAEDQLASETPVEAALLCDSLERMGYSRHEGIHALIMIIIHMIFDAYKNGKPFDEKRYRRLLIKCRKVEPSEMQDVVEREFSSN